jgi:hypothetical protein
MVPLTGPRRTATPRPSLLRRDTVHLCKPFRTKRRGNGVYALHCPPMGKSGAKWKGDRRPAERDRLADGLACPRQGPPSPRATGSAACCPPGRQGRRVSIGDWATLFMRGNAPAARACAAGGRKLLLPDGATFTSMGRPIWSVAQAFLPVPNEQAQAGMPGPPSLSVLVWPNP